MFIPCFICAELLGEKNSLSVSLGTLCVPWSSHQAQLFVLFNWKLPPCVLPQGGRTPSARGLEELGDASASPLWGLGRAEGSSVGERGDGLWGSSPDT